MVLPHVKLHILQLLGLPIDIKFRTETRKERRDSTCICILSVETYKPELFRQKRVET